MERSVHRYVVALIRFSVADNFNSSTAAVLINSQINIKCFSFTEQDRRMSVAIRMASQITKQNVVSSAYTQTHTHKLGMSSFCYLPTGHSLFSSFYLEMKKGGARRHMSSA